MNRSSLKNLVAGMVCALAMSSTSVGEVVGLHLESGLLPAPVPTSWGWVAVANLYAISNSPNDNVIGVSNATIFLTGPVKSWYNESPGLGQPVAGAAPLTGIDPDLQPQMAWESFVTIGHDQTATFNDTVLEPTFDEALFLTDGSIGESTGWYNSDPSNGQGLVGSFSGPYGKVLLGYFTIVFPEDPYAGGVPTLNITSMRITYTTGLFGTDMHTWTLTTPFDSDYYIPAPGAALPFAIMGLFARRRRA